MSEDQPKAPPPKGEPTHFAYIDAVRGIAFLSVIAFHSVFSVGNFPGRELITAGTNGVQLFFLASAITLCYSMSARSKRDAYPTLYFYLRRLFRIAPLFWAAMAFYWIFPGVMPAFWLGQWAPLGVHPAYFVLTALFLHGWHPYTFNSIVPGGWSIAVEMNFYVLFPLLFHLLGRSVRRSTVAVLLAIVYLAMLGRALPWLHHLFFPSVPNGDQWLFFEEYWFPAQLPVFLIGFLTYRLTRIETVKALMRTRFWAGCLLAASLMVMLTRSAMRSGGIAPHIVVIFGLAGAVLSISGGSLNWLVNPAIRYIGKISYSCYLVHFAALGVTLKLLGIHLTAETGYASTGHSLGNLYLFFKILAIALTLTVIIATITLHTIENPGIALGRRLLSKITAFRERQSVRA